MKAFVGNDLVTRIQFLNDLDPFSYGMASPEPLDPPTFTFNLEIPLINQLPSVIRILRAPHGVNDATLQVFRDGDFGNYLDTEATLNEQMEEFEGFGDNPRNALILRTQLSVRVHLILEKLMNSDGKELRRALFSLKQIFQDDKDLVHGFVENNGLECLIKIGSETDQNYQNYILRALGQVMLYVDGMNGIMEHNETVQWLYALIASKYRLVVKTVIKLLLVFVEYTETNCLRLVQGIRNVDVQRSAVPWYNVMLLLSDADCGDWELLTFAMKLVNNTLQEIIDRDLFCLQVEHLNQLGMAKLVETYLAQGELDVGFSQQLMMYQTRLRRRNVYEMGENDAENDSPTVSEKNSFVEAWTANALSDTLESFLSVSNSLQEQTESSSESRKTSIEEAVEVVEPVEIPQPVAPAKTRTSVHFQEDCITKSSSLSSSSSSSSSSDGDSSSSGSESDDSSSSSSSEDEAEKEKTILADDESTAPLPATEAEPAALIRGKSSKNLWPSMSKVAVTEEEEAAPSPKFTPGRISASSKSAANIFKLMEQQIASAGKIKESLLQPGPNKLTTCSTFSPAALARGDLLSESMNKLKENTLQPGPNKLMTCSTFSPAALARGESCVMRKSWLLGMMFAKENSSNGSAVLEDPDSSGEAQNVVKVTEDLSGVVSRAKESLNRCKSRPEVISTDLELNKSDKDLVRKSSHNLQWSLLASSLDRPLTLCDLDFTDLQSGDDEDVFAPELPAALVSITPGCTPLPPPPPSPIPNFAAPPPPPAMISRKSKKTVKLFWQEVREDPTYMKKLREENWLWDEIPRVAIDAPKLEYLFENRAAQDLSKQKQQEAKMSKELVVLDAKRSNTINIALTKLPPPRTIKAAILKMDATIVSKEGIEKILALLPSEDERQKITEAQMMNPDVPLGPAEQFLLTLASISEVEARLKLWAFKLEFDNAEREIAEPLMDLKQGVEDLRKNETFKHIMGVLLSVGCFLNGVETKGFNVEYLTKVPEVKDTVHKHTLLYHVCEIMVETFPSSSDLYSEIGPITRASKVDFEELSINLRKMEADCKASWEHLKSVAKHDTPPQMKTKLSEFLTDSAERIVMLGVIHRRVMNRYKKFLLWLGLSPNQQALFHDATRINRMCKIISEFALEYRTTRERVLSNIEKKRLYRQRNRTRGKMITECKTPKKESRPQLKKPPPAEPDDADQLNQILRGGATAARARAGRTRQRPQSTLVGPKDGDDDMMRTLMNDGGKQEPRRRVRRPPVERRTLRHGLTDSQRKSLGLI